MTCTGEAQTRARLPIRGFSLFCLWGDRAERTVRNAIDPGPSATRGRPSLALRRCLAEDRGGDPRQTATRDSRSLALGAPESTCHIPGRGQKEIFIRANFLWAESGRDDRSRGRQFHDVSAPRRRCLTDRRPRRERRAAIGFLSLHSARSAPDAIAARGFQRHAGVHSLTVARRASYHRRAIEQGIPNMADEGAGRLPTPSPRCRTIRSRLAGPPDIIVVSPWHGGRWVACTPRSARVPIDR